MPTPFRALTLLVVIVISLAACDGTTDTTPSPSPTTITTTPTAPGDTSPSPDAVPMPSTSTASPTSDGRPDAAAIAALAQDTWNLARASDLPPGQSPPAELITEVEALTAPGSEARTAFLNHLDTSFGPDLALRGDVIAEPLERPATDGTSITVPLCISEAVANTADGPDAIDIDITDTYSRLVATVVEQDGTWVLSGWTGDTDTTPLDPCVPPSQRDAITSSWNSFIDAQAAYRLDTSDEGTRDSFAEWISNPESNALSREPRRIVLDGTHISPEIAEVGRETARLWWCQDPELNPRAGVVNDDGTVTDLPRIAYESTWQHQGGQWLFGGRTSFTESRQQDVPVQWERCFGA